MNKRFFGLTLAGVVLGGILYFSGAVNLSASLFEGGGSQDFVLLETDMGDIKIQLHHNEAPKLAQNFVALAKEGKYHRTPFHRVINGFMVQGGDYENMDGTGGQAYEGGSLEDEFSQNLSHVRGAVSMANRGPNTNASQFFIVHEDATFLDGRHSIIGQVVSGMAVVDKIASMKTDISDRPLKEIFIKKATPLSE